MFYQSIAVYKNPNSVQINVENSLDLSQIRSWYLQLMYLPLPNLPRLPIAERVNICYMGTLVRSGNGKGVVVATGKDTELGHICGMMQEVC